MIDMESPGKNKEKPSSGRDGERDKDETGAKLTKPPQLHQDAFFLFQKPARLLKPVCRAHARAMQLGVLVSSLGSPVPRKKMVARWPLAPPRGVNGEKSCVSVSLCVRWRWPTKAVVSNNHSIARRNGQQLRPQLLSRRERHGAFEPIRPILWACGHHQWAS